MNKDDLCFEGLCRLTEFLGQDLKETGEEKVLRVTARLTRFFEYLTSVQIMTLSNIVRSISYNDLPSAEDIYDKFLEQDVIFVPTGDSEEKAINPYNLATEMCEEIWKKASENIGTKIENSLDRQAVAAKSLDPLKAIDITGYNYLMRRKLFTKKHSNEIAIDEFKLIETELKYILGENDIATRILKYIEGKKKDDYLLFFKHFETRLDSLAHDSEMKSRLNRDFFDNLKSLQEHTKK